MIPIKNRPFRKEPVSITTKHTNCQSKTTRFTLIVSSRGIQKLPFHKSYNIG
jgi:hypothetical protein